MNAATASQGRKHFTVAIDWNAHPIEWHLEQYGSWLLLDGNYETYLGSRGILGHVIDAENGIQVDRRFRAPPRCKIDVFHAMAVEDLLSHMMQTENEKVKHWIKCVVIYHVDFKKEDEIAKKLGVSEYSVQRDKMLGLVRIASRFKIPSRLMG
ncbi:hypothetical protein SOI71_05410 [Acinetobacter pittii]|uniref:hypothetical protein n=1 Tax=Acinetobacter pittii TaxID=48296 RepID=UPI000CE57437|nr:hypothetical protein [Acinetobacter pittii]PPC02502.1 hypothetical protein ApiMCR53_05855 [Acinetobacter pittii]WPP78272.1 hypothetical protein SOI71_05410 [Acinetobacter pittii]